MEQKPEYAAFPQVEVRNFEGMLVPYRQTGMTLRDYFAGQALAGFCADPSITADSDQIAPVCYKFADSMLKAREVKP